MIRALQGRRGRPSLIPVAGPCPRTSCGPSTGIIDLDLVNRRKPCAVDVVRRQRDAVTMSITATRSNARAIARPARLRALHPIYTYRLYRVFDTVGQTTD